MASARRGRGAEGGGWRQKKKVKHTPFLEGCGQWEGGPQIRPLGSNFRSTRKHLLCVLDPVHRSRCFQVPSSRPGYGEGPGSTPHPIPWNLLSQLVHAAWHPTGCGCCRWGPCCACSGGCRGRAGGVLRVLGARARGVVLAGTWMARSLVPLRDNPQIDWVAMNSTKKLSSYLQSCSKVIAWRVLAVHGEYISRLARCPCHPDRETGCSCRANE